MKFSPAIEAEVAETRALIREGYPWWLRGFMSRDVIAITLGRRVYLRPALQRSERAMERLLWHELAHIRQVNRLGLLRFLWQYLFEFAGHYLRERSVSRAYRLISFEVEAWAAEDRADV